MYNTVFIDGDLELHKALHTSKIYELVSEEGTVDCDSLWDARAKWKDLPYAELHKTEVVRSIRFYENRLKSSLIKILDDIPHKDYVIATASNNPGWKINKRYQIGRSRPYKGSRGPKPEHFEKLKQYMVNNFNCVIVDEGEVDDWLGINQKDGNIIVTIDKDAYQVPGKYYNTSNAATSTITDPGGIYIKTDSKSEPLCGSGFIWFCAQTLMGDTTDGIGGCPGFGKAAAIERFSEVETEEEAWQIVIEEYSTCKKLKDHTQEERMEMLAENARLVWIPRNEDEMYRPVLKGKDLLEDLT